MSDGLESLGGETEEVVDLNLDSRGGLLPPKNGKILLVDADTVLYSACLNCAIVEELLPEDFYTQEEWAEYLTDPSYDEESNTIQYVFEDDVDNYITDKLNYMLEQTGCIDWELHLTGRKEDAFRYKLVDKMYKANRVGNPPPGLIDTKVRWVDNNPTKCFMWHEWEADDMVVALRRDNPDKYIMAAVDKDVLYSIPGKHFNYYTSVKYGIDMKWVEVPKRQAILHHYMQTLTGDSADNIPGLKGVGKITAEKILADCDDAKCAWQKVVEAYEARGMTVIDAITNMRLAHMHQVMKDDKGEYRVVLWKPNV